MSKVDFLPNKEFQLEVIEMLRIANQAVQKAKAENKKLGIPESFVKNGKLYYLLADGTITDTLPKKKSNGKNNQ